MASHGGLLGGLASGAEVGVVGVGLPAVALVAERLGVTVAASLEPPRERGMM